MEMIGMDRTPYNRVACCCLTARFHRRGAFLGNGGLGLDSLKASCSLGGTEVFRLGGVRRKSARLLPVLLRHTADVIGEVRVPLIVRPFEDVGNGGDGRKEEHEDG